MATTQTLNFIPIRSDNAYFGFGIQTVQGTAVAPTYFIRFLDGSGIEPDMKMEEIWEGDGSRHLSQIVKTGQKWKVKMTFHPRPDCAAFFESLAAGALSDTYTAPVLTTTTTAAITKNVSTSVLVTSITGLPSTGVVPFCFDKGLATEEFVPIQMPASTLTLTVASTYNSGAFAQSHTSSAAVVAQATHAIVDQYDGYYFSSEVCIGGLNSQLGEVFRIRDCKLASLKRTGDKGKPLMFEAEITGIAVAVIGSPSSPTWENRQIFLFQNSRGGWTLNGSISGDAKAINKFSIDQKNGLDDTLQAENLTDEAIIFGNYALAINLDLIMTNMNLINLTYLGSATGTADNQAVGSGSAIIVFSQADGFHSITYNIATMVYTVTKPPAPKKDGKAYILATAATATSNMGANANLMTCTVTNLITSAY